MKILLIFTIVFSIVCAEYKSYNGFKIYEVFTEGKVSPPMTLFEESGHFTVLPSEKINCTKLLIAPQYQDEFENIVITHEVYYDIVIENVADIVAEEHERDMLSPKSDDGTIDLNRYNRYGEIQNYLIRLEEKYSDIVSLENIATTFQGRNVTLIKIGTHETEKPTIFIDAGIHAREWISPATVLYIVHQLVENENNRELIENVNWYIIPLLNPDGYEYTHTDDRYWRKNLSPGIGGQCVGVDLNRNFEFHWMEVGASTNMCSDSYAGPKASSEAEIIGLTNAILKYKENTKLYLSFHSYGKYIMYPWAYSTLTCPINIKEHIDLAVDVQAAIASNRGTRYRLGTPSELLNPVGGSSIDWIKAVAEVDLVYGFELTGGDDNTFELPESKIRESVEEIWNGILVYHKHISNNYVL